MSYLVHHFRVLKDYLFLLMLLLQMPANTEADIKGNTKNFFPRGKKNYNVLIDGRTFYDQQINV